MTRAEWATLYRTLLIEQRLDWLWAQAQEWLPTPVGPHTKDVEAFLASIRNDPRMRPKEAR